NPLGQCTTAPAAGVTVRWRARHRRLAMDKHLQVTRLHHKRLLVLGDVNAVGPIIHGGYHKGPAGLWQEAAVDSVVEPVALAGERFVARPVRSQSIVSVPDALGDG